MLAPLHELALNYTAAWCSQDAASVAAFFTPHGILTINDGIPSCGRAEITDAVQGFMTAFPDLKVSMEQLAAEADHAVYYWRLDGTNTGPGGTGKRISIRGFERWTLSPESLIADSKGTFDSAEYERQLQEGADL